MNPETLPNYTTQIRGNQVQFSESDISNPVESALLENDQRVGPPGLNYFAGNNYLDPGAFPSALDESDYEMEELESSQIVNSVSDELSASTVHSEHWLRAAISSQSHITHTNDLISVTLRAELDLIRSKERPAVTRVRAKYAEIIEKTGDKNIAKDAANEVKKSECGYVTFSGTFETRSNGGLKAHSGILMFDLDDLADVQDAKKRLSACPNVAAVFLSVSGTGLRVLVPVTPIPKDAAEHKAAYYAALPIVEGAAGIVLKDHAGQDVARASFITFDPDMHLNVDAVPLPWNMKLKGRSKVKPKGKIVDEDELTRRRDYVDNTFSVLDWKSDFEANIECPGKNMHTGCDECTDCSVWIDGVPNIRCHHNSCEGEVEAAENKMRASLRPRRASSHTQIDGKPALRLPEDGCLISDFAIELADLLRGEGLFARNGCTFALDASGQRLEPVTPDWLRTWIELRVVCYKRVRGSFTGDIFKIKKTLSKGDAMAVAVAPQFLAQLPRVEFFQTCRMPIMRQSGKIELLPAGHDSESSTFTKLNGVEFADDMDVTQARTIIENVLSEFPFAEDQGRSKAVAVAAMLTVFGAGLLPRGATRPVIIYLGNAEGTGKTTLARVAGISYGIVAADCAPTTEEEWQKQLLAGVIAGRRLMLFDNVKGHLDSPALERYATATMISGRILGLSKEFSGDAGAVVLITGNRLTISPDLRRRTLAVQLFMRELRAEDRVFQRTLDEVSLVELQPQILGALWALIRSWDAAGRPSASRNNASFPRWCEVIGGIVEHAGFGCPTTPAELVGMGDTDTDDIQRLGGGVLDGFPYPFAEIVEHCRSHGLFERFTTDIEGDGLSRKARTGFSRLLKNYEQRMVTPTIMLRIAGDGHAKRYIFQTQTT